jgi:hypothetical protein
VRELESDVVLADGYFRIIWNDVAVGEDDPPVAGKLRKGETYLARVEIVFNGVSFTAAVTYTLSLAPEYEQISMLSDQISKFEHGITNQVQDLTDVSTNFYANAMRRLNTITGQVASVETGVSNLVTEIGDFSNTVVRPLALLTNQMLEVIAPSMSNVLATVSNISRNTSADQARILNRPTTVEMGSTNTILYKTTPNVEFGRVTVTAEGTGDGTGIEYTMTETTPGVGVYAYDMIADWGTGSYTITCKDPNASDSMIIEVVSAGADTIAGLSKSIAEIESKLTGMSDVMTEINNSFVAKKILLFDT